MKLPGEIDIIITGGNSHLVCYIWEKKKLVEIYSEKIKNTIEIEVTENWFAIKYKKYNAKIYEFKKEGNLVIEGSWPLKIKTMKNKLKTFGMARFRKNYLIIYDFIHDSNQQKFAVELFDTKKKQSVSVTEPQIKDTLSMINLSYGSKYALMVAVDRLNHVFAYKVSLDDEDPTKLNVNFFAKRILSCNEKITSTLVSPSGSHFIFGTSKGNILIGQSDELEFEIKISGKGKLIDLCLFEYKGKTFLYAVHGKAKLFSKVAFESGLGNILLDRIVDVKQTKKDGKK